jgi:glycosyltransferase involved in cell wall biosynthesis
MKVSACIITYNQENYIRECLEGAIMQKINCTYEIVIGEDCSTDKTLSICNEYALLFPQLIRIIPKDKNLGMIDNWKRTISNCEGKYIAFCEGDDYWTDPLKLQKQVDFLEANEEYGMVGTGFENFDNETNAVVVQNNSLSNYEIDFESNLIKNKFGTLTVMFRSLYIKEYINLMEGDLMNGISIGDYQLWLTVLKYSKGYNLKDITSRYRILKDSSTGRGCRNKFLLHLQSIFKVQLHFTQTLQDPSRIIDAISRKYLLELFLSDYIEEYRRALNKFKINGFKPSFEEKFCYVISRNILLKKFFRKILVIQLGFK